MTARHEVSAMSSKRSATVFVSPDLKFYSLRDGPASIEEHYSKRAGKSQPMDIEWAKDGITGELFIFQARPETVHSTNRKTLSKPIA